MEEPEFKKLRLSNLSVEEVEENVKLLDTCGDQAMTPVAEAKGDSNEEGHPGDEDMEDTETSELQTWRVRWGFWLKDLLRLEGF